MASEKRKRRIRYNVAMSLDGFIAGQQNEFDWIKAVEVDFAKLFAEFDTFLLGRRTWEVCQSQGDANPLKNVETLYVFSRTLRASPSVSPSRDTATIPTTTTTTTTGSTPLSEASPNTPSSASEVGGLSSPLAYPPIPSNVTIVSSIDAVASLKADPTKDKDIWLFGGGLLFRDLLDRGLVDTVEVAVMPILLGRGIPVLSEGRRSPPLKLVSSRVLASGVVVLNYDVQNS